MEPYLQFDGVTKRFGLVEVVSAPFDLDVPRNQFLVFLGPSGCGKTTLMRMVGGLEEPSSGEIRLDGEPVGPPSRKRGMVFQSYSSFPWLTAEENVRFGMKYRRDLTATEKTARTRHYLKLVGLADFAKAYPKQISGGMRQRLAIARTLAAGSEVLLMDEPFGALDALRREGLQAELRSIQHADSKTIIFVTHDVEEAAYLADRIIIFSRRPAAVLADIDVTTLLGTTRPPELRESQAFLDLRRQLVGHLRASAAEDAMSAAAI